MFSRVLRRLTTERRSIQRLVRRCAPCLQSDLTPAVLGSTRTYSDQQHFDSSLLQVLVCPLSKKTLRYEVKTNELINEELGIAYPIIDGIPNMIPQDARLIQKDPDTPVDPTQ
ncbi:hypothetical protein NHX12_003355 [Muraenolepis orangiensis]|uniref:Protein preY, mitochondrial n=1 Tax=Muraenolepis orangiensis TaxID=630683 RepID=A0A9Q0DXW1_9TELE|nr:hypothetical protein NHX12_003355 [Muraenolepis orangiensis]